MLRWFSRQRKPADKIMRIAARPLWLLDSRRPLLTEVLWHSPYCCTMVYFWTALITEQVCGEALSESGKRKLLQQVFARIVKDLDGDPRAARKRVLPDGHLDRRRALVDLKRVVTLYSGAVNDSLMIYPDFRKAIEDDGRPALPDNRWGLRQEAAHEILMARYLAADVQGS
jgi:hypothetical protein